MTPEKLKIVAIIPCFNTEKHIAKVVTGVKKYIEQVIVINDASDDQTSKVAQDAGAKVINQDVNRGKCAAMKLGIQQVYADIIVFIDGDGQHNPDEIPSLLKPILDGNVDMVLGSRFLPNSKKINTPFIRQFANFIASVVISFYVSSPLIRNKKTINKDIKSADKTSYHLINGRIKWFTDCTGGFRAVKKDSWQKLTLVSDGYQIEAEMIYEAVKNGLTIAEVPVSCIWNGSVSKLNIVRDGIKTLGLLIKKINNNDENI